MRPPSTTLLKAILEPTSARCFGQIRASSTGRNLTGLDKLHRRQKQDVREERLASIQRAETNPALNFTPQAVTPLTPDSSQDAPSTSTPERSPPNLPYTIARTRPGHHLPVYNIAKAGGNKHLTRLRKASGDLNALKTDLTKALGLDAGTANGRGKRVDAVYVNWQNNHVMVKGWRSPEIKAWAESAGF